LESLLTAALLVAFSLFDATPLSLSLLPSSEQAVAPPRRSPRAAIPARLFACQRWVRVLVPEDGSEVSFGEGCLVIVFGLFMSV